MINKGNILRDSNCFIDNDLNKVEQEVQKKAREIAKGEKGEG